jgi:hypothetical protein
MMSGYFDGSNTCTDAFVVARATASVMAPIKPRANMVVFPSWAILFRRGRVIARLRRAGTAGGCGCGIALPRVRQHKIPRQR